MEIRAGNVTVHYDEHGAGTPVVVLHGAGVDHREPEACFEPILSGPAGWRRVYPDLPGMGLTSAPDSLRSADDVLDLLLAFSEQVTDGPFALVGHSAGGYFARAMASRRPQQVLGLALVCPLLSGTREVPPHRVVAGSGDLGDAGFQDYFVVQTPEMLDRYRRYVAPAIPLVDEEAMARIGERWELTTRPEDETPYGGPTLLVAGRQDSTVGYAATADLLGDYPRATCAVVDDAGHALPHEKPELLRTLVLDWLDRVER
jgi:pimeloyl-ACP methyl ester carboxylesterase